MPNFVGVRHVGLSAQDPAALVPFYRDVLGMTLVHETPADAPIGVTVFLSRHPEGEEDHDLVIFPNPIFAHTAFEVASLVDLQAAYREVKAKVPVKFAFNHGVALSFYIDDPEGHSLEIYWSTGVSPQERQRLTGYAQPIDLDLPEEELRGEVERVLHNMTEPEAGSAAGVMNASSPRAVADTPQEKAQPLSPHDVAGTWDLTIATPVGKQSVTVVLDARADGTLQGLAPAGGDTTPLANLQLDGNRLSWDQEVTRPIRMGLHFDVTIAGDTLNGTAKAGTFPASNVTGARSSTLNG